MVADPHMGADSAGCRVRRETRAPAIRPVRDGARIGVRRTDPQPTRGRPSRRRRACGCRLTISSTYTRKSATDAHMVLPPKPELSRGALGRIAGGHHGGSMW